MAESAPSLVERLRAAIAQDELWALAASAPRDPDDGPTVAGGVHWTWAVGDNWDPIEVDPLAPYVGRDDGSEPVTLITVEAWPLSWGGPDNTLPHNVCEAEEIRSGDAGHIVRHDPARVLRTVAAHRRILERHAPRETGPDAAVCTACVATWHYEIDSEPWPCADVRDLAAVYFPEAPDA